MYLAFRGITLILLAPSLALLTIILTGGLPILSAYTQIFMANTGDFIVALFLAILLLIACNWKRLTDLRASFDKGTDASVLPIFNTASLVGFGAVIAALPVFGLISEAVLWGLSFCVQAFLVPFKLDH
jgi:H+/gluconate symporter-like permease